MLTYQLHTRIYRTEDGRPFNFPARAILEIKFAPGTAFGTEDNRSRTIVKAHAATVSVDSNTGRWFAQSRPPLEPLEVILQSPDTLFTLNGDELSYEFPCSSIEELEGTITGFKWILPALLNLQFPEAPIIKYIRGTVGDTKFRWEHRPEEWRIHMRTVTTELLQEHVVTSWESLPLFNEIANRRLAAALSYFHVAVRLSTSGDSPWEFMAESILNYAKCLEILFGSSRDDIRRALGELSFSPDEIEGDFIPLLILRNWVDVAHPRVAIFKRRDLQVLYRYMASCENRFRAFLIRLLAAVKDGTFQLTQDSDLSLDAKQQRDVDRLVSSMESRIGAAAESMNEN